MKKAILLFIAFFVLFCGDNVQAKQKLTLPPLNYITQSNVAVSSNISNGNSDTYWRTYTAYLVVDSAYAYIGNYGGVNYGYGTGLHFTDIDIPQSANITAAYISVMASSSKSTTTVNARIFAEATDNATDFSGDDANSYAARHNNITSANVSWDNIEAFVDGEWYNTPSIVSCVQEIINRGGWTSGNSIVFFIDDYDNSSTDGAYRLIHQYEANPLYVPKLYIEYTIGEEENDPPTVEHTFLDDDPEVYQFEVYATVTDNGSANVTSFGHLWSSGNKTGETGYILPTSWPEFRTTYDNLAAGTVYWFMPYAANVYGVSYGANISGVTKPNAPINLTSPSHTYNTIDLSWTKGIGSENTTVVFRTDGQYPANIDDGTVAYAGTANATQLDSLSANTTHKIRIWAANTDLKVRYSDSYDEITVVTDIAPSGITPPSSLILTDMGANTILAEWIATANYTMVRISRTSYPASITDGELAYYGTSEVANITGWDLDILTAYVSAWGFASDNSTYSNTYIYTELGGEGMTNLSYVALCLPMIIFFILSLVFYGKGLVHITTLACALFTGYVAITQEWGIIFFPMVVGIAVIAIILFFYSMTRGDWL